ncbi:glutamine--fructose-6-phosphate transaminase (isomerizing), partial [Candidatus Micrarchaeota archaeon]|nr:glutamine--fructose-6-phosphate transaminase (isomerizing) [Candidatus Micrarchaeota archaeon]
TAGLDYTKRFIPLNENEVAILSPNSVELLSIKGEPISREPMVVEWSKEMAEKSGFPHFMLKEINEQPASAKESFSSDISPILSSLQKYQDIDIVACGTSYHTSLHLKYLLEKFLSKRANAVIASEYQYTSSPSENTFVLAISQSGETADTMAALRYAKKKGAHIIAITNVVGSSITRLADKTVFLNAGPEVSVAATKTFTSQLALAFKIVFPEKDFSEVSEILKDSLHLSDKIKEISKTLINKQNVFFIGRAQSFPITLEGALKFKEISYIHAEAYPGGELKHGPISLIEEKTPVIVFAPSDETVEKLLGNIREVKARGAYVISFTDSEEIMNESDESIRIITPREKEFYPFSFIIPLQLLAYHASVLRGINPDRPRNLAKSVTVE